MLEPNGEHLEASVGSCPSFAEAKANVVAWGRAPGPPLDRSRKTNPTSRTPRGPAPRPNSLRNRWPDRLRKADMNSVELSSYLARIGIDSSLPSSAPSVDLLIELQRAHRSYIPFENLDIHMGRSISLVQKAIFDKIVIDKRGGYCFEQNILFLDALTSLGFVGRPALGRVWLGASAVSPTEIPPRTHAINLVKIDGAEWLADAGFGHGAAPVMRLMEQRVVAANGSEYRLQQDQDYGWMLQCNGMRQYSFTLDSIWPNDLIQANHYTSTFSTSRFINNVIVSISGNDGFVSIFNERFTIFNKSQSLMDRHEYRRVLHRYFGLTLSEDDWSRLRLPFLGKS
jgi:N-hydroxyarylamine O-acetyltransferase